MQHGVPRSHRSRLRSDAARLKELHAIEEYNELEAKVQAAVTSNLNREALSLTSKLLKLNPEYYTIWNHRRRILEKLFHDEKPPAIEDLLGADLHFLLPLLVQYPKCYWIWNFRLWILERCTGLLASSTTRTFWQQELDLVGKMLRRDSRNFHGWAYRRTIIDALRFSGNDTDSQSTEANTLSLTSVEFAYTTTMIKRNLSNFSAWHQRSKLIPVLLDESGASSERRKQLFDEELALIQSALFTDPYDQSLWFYHDFLMLNLLSVEASGPVAPFVQFTSQNKEIYLKAELAHVKELLEDTDDCKWVYQFLLHYSVRYSALFDQDNVFTTTDLQDWLDRLRKLDPLRNGRWDDLEKTLRL